VPWQSIVAIALQHELAGATEPRGEPIVAIDGPGRGGSGMRQGTALNATLHAPAHSPDLTRPPSLRDQDRPALFLDFDGTMVEIADRPDAVEVSKALPGLIAGVSRRLDGRLAIVSGRTLAVLDELLGPLDVAMAGSHGGEFRVSAESAVVPLADPLPAEVATTLLGWSGERPGLIVEPKPYSIAVHYRHNQAVLPDLLELSTVLAAEHGLALKHGKLVIELTMPGSDKGTAVARFMDQPAFTGATPLFVGDDVTDEDAFVVVERFGGAGILVGPQRETAAHWRLPGVAEVHAWLGALLEED